MELLPHQQAALRRLDQADGKQLLALAPGAGKTLTALTYLRDKGCRNVLILAPASVVGVWRDESLKWETTEVMAVRGSKGKRITLYKRDEGWFCMGYELFRSDWDLLKSRKWDAVVLDESHKIASPTSQISKLVRAAFRFVPIRILLSGTPLKNSWMDLWPQIDAVCPGAMGATWYWFRQHFAIMPIPNLPVIKGWRDVVDIKRMAQPHMFTVDKEEIRRNLPPATSVDVRVELTPKEAEAYRQLRDELRLELDGKELTVANAMVKVGRLRQCTGGLHVFGIEDSSSKLKALKELLATLEGEKVILFTVFAETARWLATKLEGVRLITGETTGRDEIIADWKSNGTLLVGTSAVSNGLNLQDAHYVVQWDLAYTKAEEEQRIGRAWRTGQKNPVTVYNLLADDTIDWGVRKLIEKKRLMADDMASATMEDIKSML
jgi:SNF2 family DNA or RNA helicase